MEDPLRIGIIICDRYKTCAGGKCFRAMQKREGAFTIYNYLNIELAGYTSCGGCPGGNIEYAPQEMQKNSIQKIHFATGMIVGYPPCPYIDYFKQLIETKYHIDVILGTHPIPDSYYKTHTKLQTWKSHKWQDIIQTLSGNEKLRVAYN